ncbi:acyl-CoA dehydrogenase [Streptomyces sp. M10(2022)]
MERGLRARPARGRGIRVPAGGRGVRTGRRRPARWPGPDRLAELERLFALQWVARNSGDLLAAGLLGADQVNALPDAAEELITAVAAHAPELVKSFALPEALLADWPIAGPDYAAAYDDPDGPWHAGTGGPSPAGAL